MTCGKGIDSFTMSCGKGIDSFTMTCGGEQIVSL